MKDKSNEYISKRYGKILHIFDPIFRLNFYFLYASNWKEAKKFIESYFKLELPVHGANDKDGYFCVLQEPDTQTDVGVIWARKNDYVNLAHEVFHAVCWIADCKQIELSRGSEEAFAYLHTFLMRTILKSKESSMACSKGKKGRKK